MEQLEADGLTNHEPAETKNTYWMVTAVLDPMLDWPKEKLMAALDKEGIDSGRCFIRSAVCRHTPVSRNRQWPESAMR